MKLTGLSNTLFPNGDLLNPTLDALISGQFEHVQSLLSAAKVTAPDKAAVLDQALGRDAPALALGKTDGNELAVHPQKGEVGAEVESVRAAGGAEDHIEGHLVAVVPAILAGLEEAVGAHGEGVSLLTVRTGDGPGLGAKGLAEEDTEVTDPTTMYNRQLVNSHRGRRSGCDVLHSDNANLLARAGAVANKGRVGRQARAEHRRRTLGLEGLRDREGEVLVSTNVGRVASLRQGSIGVEAAVGVYQSGFPC